MDVQIIKAVIFDFDGTLVRSHQVVFDVMIELTRGRGDPPTPDDLRKLSTHDTLRRLRVPTWQVPWFVWRARRRLRNRMDDVEFESGILDVVASLRARGVKIALVSSNSLENVTKLLDRHGARLLFDVIVGGSSLLGKHRGLARAARKLNLRVDHVISVGDETRDLDAAARVGMPALAVGWGFHEASRLARHAAAPVVATPAALLAALIAAGA